MSTSIAIAAPEIRVTFYPKMKVSERPIVSCSAQGVALMRQQWDENFYELREEARMLLLSNSCRALGIFTLSIGGLSGTVIDPAVVYLMALRTPGTKSIILAHNHPSGSKRPSNADLQLTERIKMGSQLLGLQLQDHYILTSEDYLSMADEGLL